MAYALVYIPVCPSVLSIRSFRMKAFKTVLEILEHFSRELH